MPFNKGNEESIEIEVMLPNNNNKNIIHHCGLQFDVLPNNFSKTCKIVIDGEQYTDSDDIDINDILLYIS